MVELEGFDRNATKKLTNEVTEAQRLANVDVKENLVAKNNKGKKGNDSVALQALRSMDYENKRVAYKDNREKKILKNKLGQIKQNNLKRKR